MEQHRGPGEPVLSSRQDGRLLLLRESRTPDGCTFLVNTDLTDLQRREQALIESESRLRAIFDNAPVAFFLKDAEGRYKYINNRFADWFGLDPDGVEGRTVDELLPWAKRNRYETSDRKVVEFHEVVRNEFDVPVASGEIRTFVLTKFPVLNEDRLIDVGAVMIDVTARRVAQIEAREKAGIIEATLKTIPDGLQVLDRNLDLVAYNEQLFTILDVDREDILNADNPGRALRYRLADLGAYGEGDRDDLVRMREEVARAGGTTQFEVALRNGTWIEVRGFSIDGGDGWVAVFRDITERRKLESLKRDFVTTVSHELRTPLTSIYGAMGLVRHETAGDLAEPVQKLVDIAYKNCERLVDLVDDILDIEKIEAGKAEYPMASVRLRDLVKEALESNAPYGDRYGVTFVLAEDGPDLTVRGNEQGLLQVLANLLSNASKYSDRGGRVALSIAREGDCAVVRVRDWGAGIPARYHNTIFDKFAKVDAADLKTVPGTGLGLSICKAIIDRHRGEIGVRSAVGQGSTFHFKLPLLHSLR